MPSGDIIGILSPILGIEGTLSDIPEAQISGQLSFMMYSGDHDTLRHRDYADQHPISAITGLQETLDSKLSIIDISIINCGTATEVI